MDRRRRTDNGNARTIGKARVEDWVLRRKVLAENASHTFNRCCQPLVCVWLGQGDVFGDAASIRVDPAGPIDHQVRDRGVQQQCLDFCGKERKYKGIAHWLSPVGAAGRLAGTIVRIGLCCMF